MKLKFIFLIPLLALGLKVFPQTDLICGVFPQQNGYIYYSDFVDTRELTAGGLYENAKKWILDCLLETGDVIQTDIANSTLCLTGKTEVLNLRGIYIGFTLNLVFYDGRFRYELTNFRHQIPESRTDEQLESLPAIEECKTMTVDKYEFTIQNLIQGFTSGIKHGPEN